MERKAGRGEESRLRADGDRVPRSCHGPHLRVHSITQAPAATTASCSPSPSWRARSGPRASRRSCTSRERVRRDASNSRRPASPARRRGGGVAAARLRSRLRSRLVAPVLVAAPVGLLLRQCDRFCEAQDMHDLFCQMRDVCKPAGAKCPPPWRRTPPHLPARCLQGSGRAHTSQSAA